MPLTERDLRIHFASAKPIDVTSTTPRFAHTYCSQCGAEFGPGDSGYSHCEDHQHLVEIDR